MTEPDLPRPESADTRDPDSSGDIGVGVSSPDSSDVAQQTPGDAPAQAPGGSPDEEVSERTWSDVGPAQTGPLIDVREEQRHRNVLQSRLLTGLGAVFLATLLLVIAGPATGVISEDYARDLAQMIIPALLTFGGTIVGTLYNPRK